MTGLVSSWAGSLSMGYDALSRRTQLSRPNNVNTSYTYDSLSHLLSVLHTGANDGASYVYDNAGNRTSKTNLLNGITSNYSYDPIYQLTQVLQGASQTESYSYDSVGNRLSSLLGQHSYNSSNELTALAAAIYSYDNNGSMTSKTSGTNTTTYAWDFENRLSSVTLPNNGGTVSFLYDPFGRRIQKTLANNVARNYVYDGPNIIAELNSSGGVVASYTQGAGIDEPLAMRRGGYIGYYHADGLGSITSLTNSNAQTTATYTYDSFGNTTATEGIFNPYRYTGREQDAETGLYYYRARYYDPTIGRFISEDPLGFGANGTNFYAYVENAPISLTDPMGTCDSRTKKVNQCAAALANALSAASLLGISPNNFWGQALAGNDASTMSNILTNSNFLENFMSALASNPTPLNAASLLIEAVMNAPVGTEKAVLGTNSAGTTFVKKWVKNPFVSTGTGKLVSGSISVVQAGKLLYDAGTYIGALVVCAQE